MAITGPKIPTRLPDLEHWKAQVKCQTACPVATDAGCYVQLISEGREEEAYLVARAPNPLASICGRVCAAPCEDACRRGDIDAPVSIRGLKRYLCEGYGVESMRPQTQLRLRHEDIALGNQYGPRLFAPDAFVETLAMLQPGLKRKVAVVGAGPAGLAAAHDLALLGYAVTLFEAADEPGGMMRYGIPEYRLPRTLLAAEIESVLRLGVELRLRTALTPSFGLVALKQAGYEAVFLSVGVSKGRDLAVPGVELDGVVKAVDFLLNVNRGYRFDLGRRVVVIGGGFVAFDAARTALRLGLEGQAQELAAEGGARLKEAFDSARAAIRGGATEVVLASLESFAEMPVARTTQGHEELEEARREGVSFEPSRGPLRFEGNGHLSEVVLQKVVSVFDAAGRFAPIYDDSDLLRLPADSCILAIGQRPDLSFLAAEDGVELTPAGTLRVDTKTLATTAAGVYAGGDVAFGPRNLIDAVANGKLAARSMHQYLARQQARVEVRLEVEKIPTANYRMVAGFEVLDREAPPTLDLGRRTGIAEVETGYNREQAVAQAARCLVCHVQTIYDPEACVLCSRCVDVCPEYCLAIVPLEELDLSEEERRLLTERARGEGLPLAAMVKDDERCIRCGLCAIRCPTDAMTMERFSITEHWAAWNSAAEETR